MLRCSTAIVVLGAMGIATAAAPGADGTSQPAVSLTLIPPSPVTEKITLEMRAAVWNRDKGPRTFDVAFHLDEEKPATVLHRAKSYSSRSTS